MPDSPRRRLALWIACGAILCAALAAAAPQTGKSKSKGAPRTEADRTEELLRLNNLGIAYLAQYKPAEAEKQFRQALEIDPNYVVAHINAGVAALAQVRYDDAIAAFRKALSLDPDNIYAHFNLSLIHKLQGKPDEALVEALAAVKLDPRDPDIRYHIGSLYLSQREFDKAIQEFETVLKFDPNFLSAYYSLGRAHIGKGDMDKGKTYMERHRELQAGAGATPAVGLRYGEQGRYSYAMEDTGTQGATAPMAAGRVTFVDATTGSGIDFRHGGASDLSAMTSLEAAAPTLGSGLAVGDVDGDGKEDLFFADASRRGPSSSRLYLNQGAMRFAAAEGSPKIESLVMAAAFGDMENDGDLDLVVAAADRVLLFLNDGKGRFTDAGAAGGLGSKAQGLLGGVSLADVEHDGDLDIFAAGFLGGAPAKPSGRFPKGWPGAACLLYVNGSTSAADGAPARILFTESAAKVRLDHAGRRAGGAVFGDYDNDRDIDMALASPGDGSTVYANLRDGTFGDLGASAGLPAAAEIAGLASGDYNKDGWMDLAASLIDGGPPRLFKNMMASTAGGGVKGSGMFALDVTAMAGMTSQITVPQFGIAFADVDNDGYLDLLSANGTSQGPAVFLYRSEGEGRFTDAVALTGLDKIPARGGRGLAAADLDVDGDLDLVITNAGDRPTILRNDGGNASHWIRIAPSGLHSNRPGVGTKAEVKSGRLWQKLEVTAGSGYLSQGSLIPHFGLGPRERVDSVRLLWPGGVLQDEVQVRADSLLAVQELDRKGSSCPILYAWDGHRMAFVSDFLGGAALGYRTGPASFNYPDTDEYVRIEGRRLQAKDGRLSLRMVNQLEETLFFDQARLLAVDHPAGTEMYPDEKLLPGPPFQPFRVFLPADARPPRAARDEAGADVLATVSAIDRVTTGPPPAPRQTRRFRGYAAEHRLTLDLGAIPPGSPVLLLLHGWIDYADSTSNIAAAQAGLTLTPPYLEALDESEPAAPRWVRIVDRMGFPAGLPKTMTVDLTGLLPAGARTVRIGTSMRIFWDRILVATRFDGVPTITAAPAVSADLRHRGFPALVLPDGERPEEYDYARDEPSTHWKTHVGAFTRHGDVEPLLREVDDRYVITKPGDEIALEFAAGAFPPLPGGWVRDYLLLADGFGKDMDLNSARPHTVGPLPFHAMRAYPPVAGEGFPFHRAGMLEWYDLYNTRLVPAPLAPLAPRSPSSR